MAIKNEQEKVHQSMGNLHFAVIEKGTSERVALIMIKRTTIHIDDVHHDNAAGIIMMMK